MDKNGAITDVELAEADIELRIFDSVLGTHKAAVQDVVAFVLNARRQKASGSLAKSGNVFSAHSNRVTFG